MRVIARSNSYSSPSIGCCPHLTRLQILSPAPSRPMRVSSTLKRRLPSAVVAVPATPVWPRLPPRSTSFAAGTAVVTPSRSRPTSQRLRPSSTHVTPVVVGIVERPRFLPDHPHPPNEWVYRNVRQIGERKPRQRRSPPRIYYSMGAWKCCGLEQSVPQYQVCVFLLFLLISPLLEVDGGREVGQGFGKKCSDDELSLALYGWGRQVPK